MNRKNLHRFENLIMLTFPIVLFAGCAGSDIKPTTEETPVAIYTSHGNPLPEHETLEISTVMPVPDHTNYTDPSISDVGQSEIMSESTGEDSQAAVDDTTSHTASRIPETSILYFGTNDYQLRGEQRDALKQTAEFLVANPGITLVINGHADERGTERYNQSLSEKRAQSVYDALISLDVPQNQLTTMGFGELQPMHDESQWDENRRVELEFENPVMLSSRQ